MTFFFIALFWSIYCLRAILLISSTWFQLVNYFNKLRQNKHFLTTKQLTISNKQKSITSYLTWSSSFLLHFYISCKVKKSYIRNIVKYINLSILPFTTKAEKLEIIKLSNICEQLVFNSKNNLCTRNLALMPLY